MNLIKAIKEKIKEKGMRIATFVSVPFFSTLMSTGVVHADIIDNVENVLGDYFPRIAGISTILATGLIAIAGLWIMLSPSQQSAARPIGWIKKIIIAYIAILAVSAIIGLCGQIANGL